MPQALDNDGGRGCRKARPGLGRCPLALIQLALQAHGSLGWTLPRAVVKQAA